MAAMPVPLKRLIEQLTRLPGVGEKSATRLAFFLLRADTDYPRALADAITALKREIRLCSHCLGFTEQDPCALCADPRRSDEVVCVVEDPADVMAIERAGDFVASVHHVLDGTLAPARWRRNRSTESRRAARTPARGQRARGDVATNATA